MDYNADVNGNLSVAERHMKLAGYPSGKYTGNATIQIVGADTRNWPAVDQIVKQAFTSLGFHTHVREVDWGVMYSRYCDVPTREIDACTASGWVRDFADPETQLYVPFYGPGITPTNNVDWGQVNDPQINAAMARAALVDGVTARAKAWADVDRMLVDRAVAVPETFAIGASIESGNVAGVTAIWNQGWRDVDFTSLK